MKTAALIMALIALLTSTVFSGVCYCVLKGDARRNWYCIACLLWGKRSER